MVGHGGSSAGSYLADPTSPIPSHCASIVETSTLRVNPHSSECGAVQNEHLISMIQEAFAVRKVINILHYNKGFYSVGS